VSEEALQENNGNTPTPPHRLLQMHVWATLVYLAARYLLRVGRAVCTRTRTSNTHTHTEKLKTCT